MLTLHVCAQEGPSFMSDRLCIRACCTLGESWAYFALTVSLFLHQRIEHTEYLQEARPDHGAFASQGDLAHGFSFCREGSKRHKIWIKDYLLLQPFCQYDGPQDVCVRGCVCVLKGRGNGGTQGGLVLPRSL